MSTTQTTDQPIEELVKEGTEIAEKKVAEANPLDAHAQMFYMYTPRLFNMLKMMNKKAVIRLLFSLIQHPIGEKEIQTRSKIEVDAFQIADQMLTSKYMMMMVTYMETAQEAMAKENAEKAVDIPTEPVVQSNNG